MQPTVKNITYYSGDDFSLYVFPKDSTGAPLKTLTPTTTTYFRIANKRGDGSVNRFTGQSRVAASYVGGPYGIFCTMSGAAGANIQNGWVYDIGYIDNAKRVTVLTGQFQVMERVRGFSAGD